MQLKCISDISATQLQLQLAGQQQRTSRSAASRSAASRSAASRSAASRSAASRSASRSAENQQQPVSIPRSAAAGPRSTLMAFSNGHVHNGLPTPTDGNSALENIRMDMENVTQSLIELGVIVHDFPAEPGTQRALEHKVKDLVSELRTASHNANELEDVMLPGAVIDYLEDGRNPDIYSREFVETVVLQNQYIRGKMQAMAQFRDILSADLIEGIPWLAEDVQRAVEATTDPGPPPAPEAKKE